MLYLTRYFNQIKKRKVLIKYVVIDDQSVYAKPIDPDNSQNPILINLCRQNFDLIFFGKIDEPMVNSLHPWNTDGAVIKSDAPFGRDHLSIPFVNKVYLTAKNVDQIIPGSPILLKIDFNLNGKEDDVWAFEVTGIITTELGTY